MKEHSKYHYSKNKQCICGKLITDYAECCSMCGNKLSVIKRRSYNSSNNPNFKGGLPKCQDCGTKLSRYDAKRCKKCARMGSNNGNYKYGNCIKWKEIRKVIFERDNYTCKICNKKENNYLNCHHIVHRDYCKDKFDFNNLITLCKDCHRYISNIELTNKYEVFKIFFQDYINFRKITKKGGEY